MKGVVLAGGTGSRLYPLSKVTNKHLLPVGKYPMIYYPISKLKDAGINDILIVTGKEHAGAIVNLLGSGCEMGLKFTYKIQDQPGGIAQALGLAEDFAANGPCTVILGDNIFEESISEYVKKFGLQENGAKILLKDVEDPWRFGIAELAGSMVLSIEEKPQAPKSNYAVTGIYLYDSSVFSIIRALVPSRRGELEISDVNNEYITRGTLTYEELKGWWSDAGTFESLQRANRLAENCVLDFSV